MNLDEMKAKYRELGEAIERLEKPNKYDRLPKGSLILKELSSRNN